MVMEKYLREVHIDAEGRMENCPQIWVTAGPGSLLQPISLEDYKYFIVRNIFKIIFIMLNVQPL